MGLQRVGHDWATELNWTEVGVINIYKCYIFLLDWPLYNKQFSSFNLIKVFVLKSILSDTGIASSDLFCFPLVSDIFFHPLIFSLVCVLISLFLFLFFPLRFNLVLFFETYSSVSSFYLILCVAFYALDKIAISPSFEWVDLGSRWISLFNLASGLGCLSNLCHCPTCLLILVVLSI